ncbi:dnc, partial [Symbiodinium microadriaticum]
ELVLCAVLSPVAATDLTAQHSEEAYATDASLARGAVCRCALPRSVTRSLWQNGDRRGAYTRLEDGPRTLLKAAGLAHTSEDVDEAVVPAPARETVPFSFDVLEVTSVIPWRGSSHINVLELAVIVALHRQLAVSAPDSRHVILVDSQVAKSAAAKGRSTSRALSYALGRSAAIQIGFGLFFAYGFAPTCLNVADDPTRFAELRPPARLRLYEALSSQEWHALTAQRFR